MALEPNWSCQWCCGRLVVWQRFVWNEAEKHVSKGRVRQGNSIIPCSAKCPAAVNWLAKCCRNLGLNLPIPPPPPTATATATTIIKGRQVNKVAGAVCGDNTLEGDTNDLTTHNDSWASHMCSWEEVPRVNTKHWKPKGANPKYFWHCGNQEVSSATRMYCILARIQCANSFTEWAHLYF